MGIPAYFRWISEKYPNIMVDCVEHVNQDPETNEEVPIDATAPNPNGVEFDNLYLDMNGIIHPCTHPEDKPAPTTEEDMFKAIFEYIDRIFSIIRPRKLVYMAIDGVAPRAKINQQRSRRFRSAKEAEEKAKAEEELREEWSKLGFAVNDNRPKRDPDSENEKPFDSNVITPGTPFMASLAIALRAYVKERIESNPAWQNIIVIFSDASVPGEGEHKIAEYIRRERAQPGYDPNIKHVMYGLDADLIMLALATHEVFFTILREEVFLKRGQNRHSNNPNNGRNHQSQINKPPPPTQIDATILADAEAAGLSLRAKIGGAKPFHLLHVHILRQYLDNEFRNDIQSEIAASPAQNDMTYDLERVLDDFVFMCFFVGNDFLPHLPTLDIREGAIEYLIELYKTEVARIGYLTSAQGKVDFARVRQLLLKTGQKEDAVFQDRSRREKEQIERAKREKKRAAEEMTRDSAPDSVAEEKPAKRSPQEKKSKTKGYEEAAFLMPTVQLGRKHQPQFGRGERNAAAAQALEVNLGRSDGKSNTASPTAKSEPEAEAEADSKVPKTEPIPAPSEAQSDNPVVEKTEEDFKDVLKSRMREKNELEFVDTIKLGEVGWKDRYYEQKFGWGPQHTAEKQMLLRKYFEGLQWVMTYYYEGCCSWGWYYPYHYAPFASDLVECDVLASELQLEKGEPFEPFSQLQAVMPASSGLLVLPKCYSDLMTDPNSPIIDYYPENFELDLNGKRFAWQGVALLPFIEEERLNAAIGPLKSKLTPEERLRNSFGDSYVMLHINTPLGKTKSKRSANAGDDLKSIREKDAVGQLFGRVSYALPEYGGHTGPVVTLRFELPPEKPHMSRLLPNAVLPGPTLPKEVLDQARFAGWKQAKYGSLGKAGTQLAQDRQRRLNTRGRKRSSYDQRGAQGFRGGQDNRNAQGNRRGFGNRGGSGSRGRPGGFNPDLPVINRPVVPVANAMFGGLGAQANPGWAQRPYNQGSGRGYRPDNMPQEGGYHQAPPQPQRGMYGSYPDAGGQGQGGGYYAENMGQGQPRSGYGGGWDGYSHSQGQQHSSGYQGGGNQGWSDYEGQYQGGFQEGQRGQSHGQSRGGSQRRGGGLSGPTAASWRRTQGGAGGGSGGGGSWGRGGYYDNNQGY